MARREREHVRAFVCRCCKRELTVRTLGAPFVGDYCLDCDWDQCEELWEGECQVLAAEERVKGAERRA